MKARILIALLEEHLEFTSLENIYNDRTGEHFSMEEVVSAFPQLPEDLKQRLQERGQTDELAQKNKK